MKTMFGRKNTKTGLPVILTFLVMISHSLFMQVSDVCSYDLVSEPAVVSREVSLSSGLTVQLSSEKDSYLLGEPVILTLYVRNPTSSPVLIHKSFDVRYGQIWPQVAEKKGTYKTYIGPGFGTADGAVQAVPMKPGEKITTSFHILYHIVTKVSHELQSCYAFNRPGTYLVRVKLWDIIPGESVYTDPVSIMTAAPDGTDAMVWNLLQTEEAAYFLHSGSLLSTTAIGIVKEFRQIITHYPDSFYTPYIRESLESYQRTGASLREYRSRMRKESVESSPPAKTEIAEVSGQIFMVKTPAGNGKRSGTAYTQKDIEEIVKLTALWTEAYNAGDLSRQMRYVTRRSLNRQSWEQGSEWRREQEAESYRKNSAKIGRPVSLGIVRITFDEDGEAVADVCADNGQYPEKNPFRTMRFVKDDDGVWRSASLFP